MPHGTIHVRLTLTVDAAAERSIRATAAEDFGVELDADMTLAAVLAAIVRNVLEAHIVGFALPIEVLDATASDVEG